jgi:hypothetical protein
MRVHPERAWRLLLVVLVACDAACGAKTGLGDDDIPFAGDAATDGDAPRLCHGDSDCLDGETCNGVEQCIAGVCTPGIPLADGAACDDGDPCTAGDVCAAGSCDGTQICTCGTDDDCLPFDDGNLCNGIQLCTRGVCAYDPATVVTCDRSGDTDCLANRCVPGTGGCDLASLPDGTACDDGNACTAGEACATGRCAGGTPSCGCILDVDCVAYEDDDLCNGTLRCAAGTCVVDPTTVVACDPSGDTACLANRCDPATAACGLAARTDGTACDDGNPCTEHDACAAGSCRSAPRTCDDGNPCTDDSCDPAVGCSFVPNAAACDDGNPCTTGESCSGGACAGTPLSCDDGNPCTDDSCAPLRGCVFTNNGASCDDGDPCTAMDGCAGGVCVGLGLPSWYADEDGDGYGTPLDSVCAAAAPPGYADNALDCCDADDRINPGQESYFTSGYVCGGSPLVRFDYNCNGGDELQYTGQGRCDGHGRDCTSAAVAGWEGAAVPACGASAPFLSNCDFMTGECAPRTEARVQGCR